MHNKITILGTGDSMGVPRVYCSCPTCEEARTGGINQRWRSAIRLETEADREPIELFVDCGPDWRQQMELLHKKELEHILITHAHYDHIAGLPQWADACRWNNKKGNLYAPREVIISIQRTFSWLHQHLTFHPIDDGFQFGGWSIEAWKVNHGKNGFSYAYRFSRDERHWVYCPDSINLQDEQKAKLFGLDLLILGTSYYQETFEFETRSVYDMVEGIQLIAETNPKQVFFTHMSHDVDLLEPYHLPPNVKLAKAGDVINLW